MELSMTYDVVLPSASVMLVMALNSGSNVANVVIAPKGSGTPSLSVTGAMPGCVMLVNVTVVLTTLPNRSYSYDVVRPRASVSEISSTSLPPKAGAARRAVAWSGTPGTGVGANASSDH